MKDENDTNTTDLLRTVVTELESDKAGRAEFTVAGFGTGTVAEIEAYIAQITDERDTARRDLAHLESHRATPDATDGVDLVATITRIAERAAERVAGEIDGDSVWDEIEYRVREVAEESAPEIDGGDIWAEISDRVDEAAADAARSVIRDELVVNADLI